MPCCFATPSTLRVDIARATTARFSSHVQRRRRVKTSSPTTTASPAVMPALLPDQNSRRLFATIQTHKAARAGGIRHKDRDRAIEQTSSDGFGFDRPECARSPVVRSGEAIIAFPSGGRGSDRWWHDRHALRHEQPGAEGLAGIRARPAWWRALLLSWPQRRSDEDPLA